MGQLGGIFFRCTVVTHGAAGVSAVDELMRCRVISITSVKHILDVMISFEIRFDGAA